MIYPHAKSACAAVLFPMFLAACGSGTPPPVTPKSEPPAAFSLAQLNAGGFEPVDSAGLALPSSSAGIRLAVTRTSPDGSLEILTEDLSLTSEGPSIAVMDGMSLVPKGAGTTSLRVVALESEALFPIIVYDPGSAPIEALWLSPADELAIRSNAPVAVVAQLRLSTGEIISAPERLVWESSDPEIAAIDDIGTVTAGSDGVATLRGRTVDGSHEAQVDVTVALPQPSGSRIDSAGGQVAADGAAAWIPPLSFGVETPVRLREVGALDLPAPPPTTGTILGGLELTTDSLLTYEEPVVLTLTPGQTENRTSAVMNGTSLVQVHSWDVVSETWRHYAWTTRQGLDALEWVTLIPELFIVMDMPGEAERLAREHAPTLVLDPDDIVPISVEGLLAYSDLVYRDASDDRFLVTATPTPDDLLANNSASFELFLDHEIYSSFLPPNRWADSPAGGLDAAGSPQATLYWSVRSGSPNRLTGDLPRSVLAIQYWMLSAASAAPMPPSDALSYLLSHQGDLEFVQVLLDGEQLDPEPVAATASQHYYGEGRPFRDVETVAGDWLAYVARGAHATYFSRSFPDGRSGHGTYWKDEGFLGKIYPVRIAVDICSDPVDQVLLRPLEDYDLVPFDSSNPGATVLREWRGTIGEVPFGPTRGPGPEALRFNTSPLRFHQAYNFSTENSIRAYGAANPADLEDRLRMGERLLRLQERQRSEGVTGPIQPTIDSSCSPQPEYLTDYLTADDSYHPDDYVACDAWRLTRVTPGVPRLAYIDEPYAINVDWSGVDASAMQPIVEPLRVMLLPAVESDYVTSHSGSYEDSSGNEIPFVVQAVPTFETAPVGASGLNVGVEWRYLEGGIEVSVPSDACMAEVDDMDWRFHLFIRDASDVTLYRTTSIQVGPFAYERDGPPVDISSRLCR